MNCKQYQKAVTAAAVLAGISGISLIGCRGLAGLTGESDGQGGGSAAAVSASGSVEAVKAHTQIAQELVQQAMPNSNSVGQAQLSAARIEHTAVLISADKTEASLQKLKEDFANASQTLAKVKEQLIDQQDHYRKLEGQWYVVWGLRIERALWTIAIGWLLAGIGSIVLGLGNPLSFTARVGREIVSLLPVMNVFGWVRDSLSGNRSGVLTAGK